MSSNKMDTILRDIKYYFHFLFQRGYTVYGIQELAMGDWQVTLALDNLGIAIYSDQGEIGIIFSPLASNMTYRVGLLSMIYYLSQERIFVGKLKKHLFNFRRKRFEELASLLENYIDQITPYFGKDYEKYELELTRAQQKYFKIYLDKYIPKPKPRD